MHDAAYNPVRVCLLERVGGQTPWDGMADLWWTADPESQRFR